MKHILAYLATLRVSQGQGAGEPLQLYPWEKEVYQGRVRYGGRLRPFDCERKRQIDSFGRDRGGVRGWAAQTTTGGDGYCCKLIRASKDSI